MQSDYWSYMDQCALCPEELKSIPLRIACAGKSNAGSILLMHDMDLARLKLFLDGLDTFHIYHAVIICYRWQMELIFPLIKPMLEDMFKIKLYALKEGTEGDANEA